LPSGFAIDSHDGKAQRKQVTFEERMARHFAQKPKLHPTAYVAPGAVVRGDVTLGEESSIWFHATLRGDINSIVIGARSNIQDGSVIHLADDFPTIVGEFVTVGHRAILHACKVGDEVLVGMGAILLDGVEVGARSIIGANALVTQHTRIPPGSLVLGSPAKVVRQLDVSEQRSLKSWAEKYVQLSRVYRAADESGTAVRESSER
jgi:carbonic anhydrase/acetyltransferase-like protein (isoleucine patch superfamily)